MKFTTALFFSVLSLTAHTHAFSIIRTGLSKRTSFVSRYAQYGPSDTSQPSNEPSTAQKEKFASVFNEIVACEVREHLPSILTKNIDILIDLRGDTGVNLFHEQVAKAEATGDEELIQRSRAAVEYMVFFLEAFVGEAKNLDDNNKQLLGKVLKCMTSENDGGSLSKQEQLDELMKSEKGDFTPGFLRYLEGECARIANAKKIDKDTTRLLEVMRMIQARIIEELGQDLGEGAQVLGQLLGYESSEERLAVLDAGLKVRGIDFGKELKAMTGEALQGFENVPGGVDPGLLAIVKEMDDRIRAFIDSA